MNSRLLISAVESGGAAKEQVIAWMKKQARSKGKRGGK